MKNVFLLSIIAIFAMGNVNAQQEKEAFGVKAGDILVEGQLGASSSNDKNTDTKTNSLRFTPSVAFMLDDQFAVGGRFSLGSSKTEVGGTDTSDFSEFGVGAFARYYFLTLGLRKAIYAELAAGYISEKNGISDVKYNGFGAGVNVGLNYFVKQNIAITFALTDLLSFNSIKADVDGAEAVTQFNANINNFNNFFTTASFGLLFTF